MSFVRFVRSATSLLVLCGAAACGPNLPSDPATTDDEAGGSQDSSPDSSPATGPDETTGPVSESETESESDSSGFVPDAATMPESCNQWLQDCPDGEKCVPYATSGGTWDALKCVPILGDAAPGDPCTSAGLIEATDDCDATSICWDLQEVEEDEFVGYCVAQCTGGPDDPMCEEGNSCLIGGDSTIALCIPNCDPVAQDCESPGTACYWSHSDFQCVPTTSDLGPNEECGFINDCASGLMCAAAQYLPDCAHSSCCTAFCDIDLPDTCADELPGTVCTSFWARGMATPPYEHVGICAAP